MAFLYTGGLGLLSPSPRLTRIQASSDCSKMKQLVDVAIFTWALLPPSNLNWRDRFPSSHTGSVSNHVLCEGMACTMQKILGDARTLLERLKEHDMAAESLVEQSGALNQRVEGMREVGMLTQENTQIKELQQENRELWLSLEEHQYALELIMGKYRKQMLLFMTAKKKMDTKPVLSLHQEHSKLENKDLRELLSISKGSVKQQQRQQKKEPSENTMK
ncbi:UNVERIFIED_CONTAM: hypothetical protein FKN15_010165 [Acipenser sinensis]